MVIVREDFPHRIVFSGLPEGRNKTSLGTLGVRFLFFFLFFFSGRDWSLKSCCVRGPALETSNSQTRECEMLIESIGADETERK